jgi:hypothetical protein
VDPIPSFAATVRNHGEDGRPVGITRRYERAARRPRSRAHAAASSGSSTIVIAAAFDFGVQDPPTEKTQLSLERFRDRILKRLLVATATVLSEDEALGRVLLQLRVGLLEEVIEMEEPGGRPAIATGLQLGSRYLTPVLGCDRGDWRRAAMWSADIGRSFGCMTLRPSRGRSRRRLLATTATSRSHGLRLLPSQPRRTGRSATVLETVLIRRQSTDRRRH